MILSQGQTLGISPMREGSWVLLTEPLLLNPGMHWIQSSIICPACVVKGQQGQTSLISGSGHCLMSVHHPVLCEGGKLLQMSNDNAGTSMNFLPTQRQVPKPKQWHKCCVETPFFASAFITSAVFVGVICPTGFVYYCCIMTVQWAGRGWGSDWHCECSPRLRSRYYNGPCNEI